MTIITPTGPEALVNTTTANNQVQATSAALANGRYVVVWVDYLLPGQLTGANTANADIKARIFNADGTQASGEFTVNTTTAAGQIFPSITTLTDGHFLVSWNTGAGTIIAGAGSPIATAWAQEFTAAGAAVGGEFQIGTPGVETLLPRVSALAGGGFVSVWQQGGANGAITAQIYNSSNVAVGSPITVDTTDVAYVDVPYVTTLANGNFVIAHGSNSHAPLNSIHIYTAAGVPVTPEIDFYYGAQNGAITGITALASGAFAVTYYDINPSFSRYWVTVFLPDGTMVFSHQFNQQSGGNTSNTILGIDVSALANGGFVVAYTENLAADGSGTSIRMEAFNGIGNQIGTVTQVNTQANGTQAGADVLTLSNGDLVVTWVDASGAIGDASGTGIAMQRFHVDPINQVPVALGEAIVAGTGTVVVNAADFLDNDIDADGDALIISAISNVTGGTATLNVGAQTITITRPGGYTGPIGIDYTVSDGAAGTATAHANIVLTRDDTVTIRGGSATINFLANDYLSARPEGYSFFLSQPSVGTARLVGADLATAISFGATYNLASGYAVLPVGQTMTTSITYSVIDPSTGLSDYNAIVNITLQGWAQIGGTGADTLTGSALADHMIGGAGAANTLIGGAGDDWYTVQATGDSVVELAGGGQDVVWTSLGVFTLPANVEVLIYTGPATPFLGLGNAENNYIAGGQGNDDLYGYSGNDVLSGLGGTNTLIGGTGNDLYNVSNRSDSTIEYANEGIDEVRTTFSIFALQNNVENLTFIDNAVHGAGVGNTLDNVIRGGTGTDDLFGREGNDTLYGGTGVANTLFGQQGDDTYIVEHIGDSVIEYAGEGYDTVQTAISQFTLRDDVEALIYTGSGSFLGVGGNTDNAITGGAGADQLNGMGGNDFITGGSGADLLQGGSGNDQFRYTGGETGLDRIIDFVSGSDKIALSTTGFVHTATVAFVSSGAPVATTTNSTFLYNVNDGIVSYDADGTGAGAAVQIAQLNAGLTLAAGDFVFF
jgi:Ca2+-binding RTX toxin-like protein